MTEPQLRVGIMNEPEINFTLFGDFILTLVGTQHTGQNVIKFQNNKIWLNNCPIDEASLVFVPVNYHETYFDLHGVTIGIQFHWERKETQRFKGSLEIRIENEKLTAINILPLEDYLVSVISSEMSATASIELLKAHGVISRSWLVAQTEKGKALNQTTAKYQSLSETPNEYIRWYDREDHLNFDVCADDHCQRYQGITRQSTPLVEQAVVETRGMMLMYDGKICDARFSKSCGGISETFENVWEPVRHPYLQSNVDNGKIPEGFDTDLSRNEAAEK